MTSQLALTLQSPSQLASAFTSAVQLPSIVTVTVTPFAAAASTRALRTAHASVAVVFVVSSLRSAFIALQTARNSASTARALVFKLPAASAYALTLACALAVTSRPSHPLPALAASFAAAQPPIDEAATTTANSTPGQYFKQFFPIIRILLGVSALGLAEKATTRCERSDVYPFDRARVTQYDDVRSAMMQHVRPEVASFRLPAAIFAAGHRSDHL